MQHCFNPSISLTIIATCVLVLHAAVHADNTSHVPADYKTIQAAVDAASDGDTILVAPGTYIEKVTLDKAVHLLGAEGAEETTIAAPSNQRAMEITSGGTNAVIEGFTITRSVGDWGDFSGGIHIEDASPTVLNCIFIDNWAELSGGAMRIVNGSPTVQHSLFINNNAQDYIEQFASGGAISVFGGAPSIDQCLFQNNHTVSVFADGGAALALWDAENASVTNCEFLNNMSVTGGAVFISQSTVHIENCRVIENSAVTGGALAVWPLGDSVDTVATIAVKNCLFESNWATPFGVSGRGGALYVAGDKDLNLHITGTEFRNNIAAWGPCCVNPPDGGGIYLSGPLNDFTLGDSLFCENWPNDIAGSPWDDLGGNEFLDDCPPNCAGPADLNCDGAVGVPDLLILLAAWGNCESCNDCPADLTGNCNVGVADLLILLANWG